MFRQAFVFTILAWAAAQDVTPEVAGDSLAQDDECVVGDEKCALNALQVHKAEVEETWICQSVMFSFVKPCSWFLSPVKISGQVLNFCRLLPP